MTNIIYPVTVFYVILIVLLTTAGININGGDIIEFPSFPTIPNQEDILDSLGIFGSIAGVFILIVEFLGFILLIFGFMFKLVAFSLTDILPTWLNIILFLPLTIIIAYEVTARFLGLGSSG